MAHESGQGGAVRHSSLPYIRVGGRPFISLPGSILFTGMDVIEERYTFGREVGSDPRMLGGGGYLGHNQGCHASYFTVHRQQALRYAFGLLMDDRAETILQHLYVLG